MVFALSACSNELLRLRGGGPKPRPSKRTDASVATVVTGLGKLAIGMAVIAYYSLILLGKPVCNYTIKNLIENNLREDEFCPYCSHLKVMCMVKHHPNENPLGKMTGYENCVLDVPAR